MTNLTAAESGIFELGEQVEVPLEIREDGCCFHQAVWFVSGRVPDVPKWPSWAAQISSFVTTAEYLGLNPSFETSEESDVRPLGFLCSTNPGLYLIQLLDIIDKNGHLVVLDVATGIFDPGTSRKNIPLTHWIRCFENRFRIRRVLQICTAPNQ